MRLKEIELRLSAIKTELMAEGADIDALDTEARGLIAERERINEQIEARNKLLKDLESAPPSSIPGFVSKSAAGETVKKRFTAADVEYRTAWAKSMLYQPLTAEERKAIADVNYRDSVEGPVTTTSTEFIEQTDAVVGQNNGGLFIPQYISDRLLAEETLESPILRDVFKMAVAGLTKYPYRVSGDPAKWREETVENDLEKVEWKELSFGVKELSKTIRISWKLEAMTPDSFIDYIIRELRSEMQKALSVAVVYGSDALDIAGLTETNLKYTDVTDNLIDTIIKAGDTIPKDKRSGAKVYVSSAIATKMRLLKDVNGNYLISPFAAANASYIGRYQMEVDPYLEDGDIFIGNLSRGVILNTAEPVSITKDVMGKKRVNDYTAFAVYGSVVVPNYVVYVDTAVTNP